MLALTYLYPYEFYLWAGWPQGMGVLLLIGLWTAALRWIDQPGARWALVGGLFAGGIVLTHGTEVYSATLGLLVIALVRHRRLHLSQLVWQLPLAIGMAIVVAAPYLPTLIGWAGAGGASAAGQDVVDFASANPDLQLHSDLVQFTISAAGATTWVDLPSGLRWSALGAWVGIRRAPIVAALWAAFSSLLFVIDFVDVPLVQKLYTLTFPWLDDRPRQVVVLLASVLAANGLAYALASLSELRSHAVRHSAAWRRVAVASVLLAGFFAEGSAVSIYKRLVVAVDDGDVYSADDGAAMGWLKLNALPGEIVVNDLATDAGIWAPYKADMAILMPRTGSALEQHDRRPILTHLLDLRADAGATAEACALHANYVYHGARAVRFDETLVPDPTVLQSTPDLEEVFSSGQAAVFGINLPCA